MKSSIWFLVAAVFATIASITEGILTALYYEELPRNAVQFKLSGAVTILFALAATAFFVTWIKMRRREAEE